MNEPSRSLGTQQQEPVPTHYEILGISEALLKEQEDPIQIIRRAYHRALLHNHPDKASAADSLSLPKASSASSKPSIDRISEAFRILSSPQSRAEYDQTLTLAQQGPEKQAFQTGIENVDLDDLEFDERESSWFRGCRCGNPKGYLITEPDLEEVEQQGELVVGCQDCSLWLKVHFAVLNE